MRNDLSTKRFLCCLALLCTACFSFPYSLMLSIFQSPIDYEISLAGNFGEPRPHHFHGGLDIKTAGREGKHIYAIADGYVSRITVGLYGFGNAVYITHPTGQTSVYCHLKAFTPRIKAALRRYQYRHETSVADARLTPLDVPVSQGQLIALSGNSGHSTAPHLHIEIHDTRTWDMLDPYPFFSDFISDTVPPQAHAFMAVPQHGGMFRSSSSKTIFHLPVKGASDAPAFAAWGRVGFAVWADDYMQGSYNHYGIHETVLTVDGRQVFRSLVDTIPVILNRMVNSWGDYHHWLHYRTWYLKSYAEPGNRLSFLKTGPDRGIIDFCEERDYHLEYLLRDYKGNEVRYAFVVRAQPDPLQGRDDEKSHSGAKSPASSTIASLSSGRLGGTTLFRWNQTNSISRPGMQLVVPYGLLATDVSIEPSISRRPGALSDAYSFSRTSQPLAGSAEISFYARTDRLVADSMTHAGVDPSKLYVSCDGKFAGGTYQRGWVTGHISELASTCILAYDNRPPDIRPLSLSGGRLLLSLSDKQSGVASFKGYVDDRFVVFDAVEKTSNVACMLNETPIKPTGTTHRLKFLVTDNCNNTRAFEADIVY